MNVDFDALQKYCSGVYDKYADKYQELLKQVELKTVRNEYTGESNIELGYYSPSLVVDIVVDNAKRGKFHVRTPKIKHYEYCFDDTDRLICTKQYPGYREDNEVCLMCFYIYEETYTLILGFALSLEDISLNFIARCNYKDSKLIEYWFSKMWKNILDIDIEQYEYDTTGYLRLCDNAHYMRVENKLISDEWMRYMFLHDEKGYISQYSAQRYKHGKPMYPSIFDVPISKRRKV